METSSNPSQPAGVDLPPLVDRPRPCIRCLRIRVTDLLELLGAGASYDEILADYPFLEREDILAALDCAVHQTNHVVLPADVQ